MCPADTKWTLFSAFVCFSDSLGGDPNVNGTAFKLISLPHPELADRLT
jgi:hypothetical protein